MKLANISKILITTFGILMGFILIDFLLGNYLNRRSINFFRIKHHYYHHGLLPSQASLGIWGGIEYPVYTNDLGFRDTTKTTFKKNDNQYHILIVGDSHAEGVGVWYKKCFPALLQKTRSDLLVSNASAVSYSPKLYYLRARYLIENNFILPDEILVMIDMSDIQNEIIYESYHPDFSALSALRQKSYEFLHRNSFIFYRTKNFISSFRQRNFAKESAIFKDYIEESQFENTFSIYADFFEHFDNKLLISDPDFHNVGDWMYNDSFKALFNKGLQTGASNIQKLKNLCDSNGIELTLSVHPWQSQVTAGNTEDEYVTFWKSFCNENQINFLNLYPAFINPRLSLMIGGGLFIPNDNHWNEMGHRIVALELMDLWEK